MHRWTDRCPIAPPFPGLGGPVPAYRALARGLGCASHSL
jgi:hypothetical protein